MNNTAVATQKEVVKKENYANPLTRENDDYLVRWCFNPVQREKPLDARECRIAIAPFAEFFAVKSFATPQEHHSIDWTKPKEELRVVTAAHAQSIIESALCGKDAQGLADWGARFGFFGEADGGKMKVISRTLLPPLSFIRRLGAEFKLETGIGEFCEGEDEFDRGTRESCPTCWSQWIESPACDEYLKYRAANGMEIGEVEDGATGVQMRNVKPSLEELETARSIAREAFGVGLASLARQWQQIARAVENRERQDVVPMEHVYRKDLHRSTPQDRQLLDAARIAKAAGEGNNDLLTRMAESTMETNALLRQVVAATNPGAERTTAAPVDFSMFVCVAKNKAGEDCKAKVTRVIEGKPYCLSHPGEKGD